MRLCIPRLKKRSGLGNELIPWAKAYLASTELDLTMIDPIWIFNPRGYKALFHTRPLTRLWHVLLPRVMPSYTFTEADYKATGEVDFDKAIRVYAEQHGLFTKPHFVLTVEGMWGGLYPVRKAKPFILSHLYRSPITVNNLYQFSKRVPPSQLVVAVHVRLGDFKPALDDPNYLGVTLTSLPMDWYVNTCRALRDHIGAERITFVLLSDGTPDQLKPFTDEFAPLTTFDQRSSDVSDLLTMMTADLLICSHSWFSRWAALYSNAPYIWYKRALIDEGDVLRTAHNLFKPDGDSPDSAFPRGVPVDIDGTIPDYLLDYLRRKAAMNITTTDLISGGAVPKNSL